MTEEQEFKNILELIDEIPENCNILEEEIDLEIQKEFFEYSQELSEQKEDDNIDELIELLNQESDEVKIKMCLAKLSIQDSVKAYRAIESFKNLNNEFKMWSTLAQQQSRMVLQSSLIDEQQIFISTGLGGKDKKLRYFFIFPFDDDIEDLEGFQKFLQSEFQFALKKHEGIIESLEVTSKYATALSLIPLKAPIPEIIKNLLDECNQLGFRLSRNVLITNMKKFSEQEIEEIIEHYDEEKD